jgi:hypothetical protein
MFLCCCLTTAKVTAEEKHPEAILTYSKALFSHGSSHIRSTYWRDYSCFTLPIVPFQAIENKRLCQLTAPFSAAECEAILDCSFQAMRESLMTPAAYDYSRTETRINQVNLSKFMVYLCQSMNHNSGKRSGGYTIDTKRMSVRNHERVLAEAARADCLVVLNYNGDAAATGSKDKASHSFVLIGTEAKSVESSSYEVVVMSLLKGFMSLLQYGHS